MSNNKPLRRGVSGVCTRSICECERDGLGDQCVWLKPAEAEFECLGEPSLCENPRGCACAPNRPPTPVGWSDTDWLKHLEEIRQDQPGCRTPAGCRENGCLGWCDEHRPEGTHP